MSLGICFGSLPTLTFYFSIFVEDATSVASSKAETDSSDESEESSEYESSSDSEEDDDDEDDESEEIDVELDEYMDSDDDVFKVLSGQSSPTKVSVGEEKMEDAEGVEYPAPSTLEEVSTATNSGVETPAVYSKDLLESDTPSKELPDRTIEVDDEKEMEKAPSPSNQGNTHLAIEYLRL